METERIMIIVNVLQDKEEFLRKEIAIDLANLKSLDVTLLSCEVTDYQNRKSEEECDRITQEKYECGYYFSCRSQFYNTKQVYYSDVLFHTDTSLRMYFSNITDGIIAIQTILDAKGRFEWNTK